MGAVFELMCSKCEYHSAWEMWIAHGYREKHDTFHEIEDGLWGEELRTAISNKNYCINSQEIMLVCEDVEI